MFASFLLRTIRLAARHLLTAWLAALFPVPDMDDGQFIRLVAHEVAKASLWRLCRLQNHFAEHHFFSLFHRTEHCILIGGRYRNLELRLLACSSISS